MNEERCCDTCSRLKDDISGEIQIEKPNSKWTRGVDTQNENSFLQVASTVTNIVIFVNQFCKDVKDLCCKNYTQLNEGAKMMILVDGGSPSNGYITPIWVFHDRPFGRISARLSDRSEVTSGGSTLDCEGRAPPPRAQNFFIFMQFSGKIGQIIGWRLPLGSWRPSLGEILDPPLTYTEQNKFHQKLPPVGFELTTSRSSVLCSTTVLSHYLVVDGKSSRPL